MIENVTPILRVEDIARSRRYYVETLGFSLDWDAEAMISVSRDGKSIMLCEREQGQPGTWLWIGVEDADALFAEVSAGARASAPRRGISPGPTSSRSRIPTATCCVSAPSRSRARPTAYSRADRSRSGPVRARRAVRLSLAPRAGSCFADDRVPRRADPTRAGLAQLVEHLICNQDVGGSSPSAGTKITKFHRMLRRVIEAMRRAFRSVSTPCPQ